MVTLPSVTVDVPSGSTGAPESGLKLRFSNYKRGRLPPQPDRLPLTLKRSNDGGAGESAGDTANEPDEDADATMAARRQGKRPARGQPTSRASNRRRVDVDYARVDGGASEADDDGANGDDSD